MTPKLSIVIVSWNVCDLLQGCLESIQESLDSQENDLPVEIIVVDNASTDGTAEMVGQRFPDVHLIETGENLGFTGGNNLGLEAAQGEYLFLLNPDTQITGDALRTLVNYMDAHPTVGAVGPKLVTDDGSAQPSRRRFPTLWTAVFESTWLQPIAPKRVLDQYYMADQPDDETQAVDWVEGAALMIRRSVYESVGELDSRFFMYSEELDWQRRIKQSGWEIHYVPDAQVLHFGSRSSDQVIAQKHIHFQTSKIRYFAKYHGQFAGSCLRWFLLFSYTWQLALESLKWLFWNKRDLRKSRIEAYYQVIKSGLPARV